MSNSVCDSRRGIGSGLAFVVTGPSGAGKNSVIDRVIAMLPGLVYSVSYTSRPRRPTEVAGADYVFVSQQEFVQRIEAGDFLEHVTYLDDHYGTSRSQIEGYVDEGLDVILNIEVKGAKSLQKTDMGFIRVLYIFLTPSSTEELESRLRKRNTEDDSRIERRLEVAKLEMLELPCFDYLIINDDLDTAVQELASIIIAERIRVIR
ncbi:guanylate kinase [Candidatus Bipolaricaulota bacterium]|nr:guanylate kinase [Candidatus Bipolaricaulota bacterium]